MYRPSLDRGGSLESLEDDSRIKLPPQHANYGGLPPVCCAPRRRKPLSIFLNPPSSYPHPNWGRGIGGRMLNVILTAERGFGAQFGGFLGILSNPSRNRL